MTYLRRSNDAHGPLRRWPIVLAGSVIFILALVIIFRPHLIPAIFTSLASPFWRAETAIQMGSLESPQSLLRENEELKRRLEVAEIRLSTIRAIEQENEDLKRSMGRASTTDLILAAVIRRPPLSPFDEIIIDAGADVGIEADRIVYAAGSVPLGRVASVFGKTSKVLLFSSPDQRFEVEIGKDRLVATAIGRGGGQYQAELPRDLAISKGDLVVAPSLGLMPFGTVSHIITGPEQPFQTVIIVPPQSLYALHWVFVER